MTPTFNGGIALGGAIYPQFTVICRNCGNTKYFNAALMGLVSEVKKEGTNVY